MNVLGKGGWLSLYKLSPEQTGLKFNSEIAARNNQKYGAAKCLRLVTNQSLERREDTDIQSLCATLREIGLANIAVQFLAAIRPFTFFDGPGLERLEVNYQIELPGGIIEPDEDARLGALREAMEEGGKAKTIQCASLMVYSSPFDAGSHVEMYSIETALVYAETLAPPAREGVIPEKCALVPLLEVQQWLLGKECQGIPIEGYAKTALALLGLELHGGWRALS